MKKSLFLCFLCLGIFGADVLIKAYTVVSIPLMYGSSIVYPYGGVPVFEDWHGISFSLNYVMNRGAAWGLFAEFQEYLLYFRFIMVGGLLVYLLAVPLSFMKRLAVVFILAGASGNVLDFFVYGHVVDLFHFSFGSYSFPIFNVADASITIGIAILLGLSFVGKKTAKKS